MAAKEKSETEESLSRIQRISKVINRFLKVIAVLLFVFLVITLVLTILCSFGLIDSGLSSNPFDLVILGTYGLVIVSLVYVVSNMFSDVAQGESLFTLVQVKRFRAIAILLLAYVVLDAFMSTGTVAQIHVGELELGYDVVESAVGSTLSINVGALLGSGFFGALSLIFEYGVLLQNFSDETL